MTTLTTEKLYVADTNLLLDDIEKLNDYKIVLLSHTLRELDKHKSSQYPELAFKSRIAVRYIKENRSKFEFDVKNYDGSELGKDFSNQYQDDNILKACVDNGYGILTNDVLLQYKAEGLDIEVVDIESSFSDFNYENNYKGFVEVEMSENEFRDFHDERLDRNEFNLIPNQYLIVIDKITKQPRQALRYDGVHYIHIKEKKLKSRHMGEFKAKDLFQECAIDTLINNKVIMLRGKAGTAKTLLAISYAMQQLQASKFDKIIVFSNSVPTKDAYYHGLVKGDLDTKLLDSSIGNILTSKLGGKEQVKAMLMTEELMILPMSDIRGFDTSEMRAIVIISEAQNTSRELMKLAIQRVGADGKIIIEGDNKTQLDALSFAGANNGMTIASEVFRGIEYYGEIELQNIYRSPWAERAELMSIHN